MTLDGMPSLEALARACQCPKVPRSSLVQLSSVPFAESTSQCGDLDCTWLIARAAVVGSLIPTNSGRAQVESVLKVNVSDVQAGATAAVFEADSGLVSITSQVRIMIQHLQ